MKNERILCWNGLYLGDTECYGTGYIARDLKLKGLSAKEVHCPEVTVMQSWSTDRITRIAERILKEHGNDETDSIVAHSYGCLVAIRCMELGAKFKHAFFLGPAASCKADIPENVKGLTVFHNHYDIAVAAGTLLPFHLFGAMGVVGYKGDFKEVTNIRYNHFNPTKYDPWNHSHYFNPEYRSKIVDTISSTLGLPK